MPLRCIFDILEKKLVLQEVTTLILDGSRVSDSVFSDILCLSEYNVRLLSVRNVTGLRGNAIQKVLRYITRPSRAPGVPKLKGLYYFNGDPNREKFKILSMSRCRVMATIGARLGSLSFDDAARVSAAATTWYSDDGWYDGNGEVFKPVYHPVWESLMKKCAGIIMFDVMLCRYCPASILAGKGNEKYVGPHIAAVSLKACESCQISPEGPATAGKSPSDHLPLLSPLPLHSSAVRATQMPATSGCTVPPLYARCLLCIMDRHCSGCHAWWCESYYTVPKPGAKADMEEAYSVKMYLILYVETGCWSITVE